MKPRPTLFLSGVSAEFASFRDAVELEVSELAIRLKHLE